CGERSGGCERRARSSLLRRAYRHASSVVAALAALAPPLVRLARHDYPDGLLDPDAEPQGPPQADRHRPLHPADHQGDEDGGGRVRQRAAAETAIVVVGRKGLEYYRRRSARVVAHRQGILTTGPAAMAAELAQEVTRRFVAKETDTVHLVYTRFRSALSQEPTTVPLLPVGAPATDAPAVDYIFEPERPALLARLLPRYVE